MSDVRGVPARLLLPLFVLSGAAGLVYEVVWARQLVLVFGNTSQAVSTILTGFFGGLALGGALGGRVADRVRRPLRLYGLLEVVLVVVVLLTPASFRLVGEAYRAAYPALAETPGALALVRFVLSLLALGPATVLMGATLPALARYLTAPGSGLAGAFAGLYAANTVGAIAGTALAGFVLVEVLGLTGALLAGAAASGLAGLAALLLDRRAGEPGAGAPGPSVAPAGAAAPGAPRVPAPRLALLLAFASGLTSLGYQVTWNRLLGAGTGSSTYVFTTILTVFLVGIALGAVAFARLRPRVRSITGLIAGAQVATAVLVVLGALLLASPPQPLQGGSGAFLDALRVFARTVVLVVLPPTIAMGLVLPATAALLADRAGREGTETGSLVAVNTVGAILATFALPFLVIPAIGSPATLALLALGNAALAAVLVLREGGAGRLRTRAGTLAAAGAAALVVASAASGGAFRDPTVTAITRQGGTVHAVAEDEIASVVAGTLGDRPELWVAGTSMTVLTVDTKLMPIWPLMLRPDATDGLVIAFGMGTSFRTALAAGQRVDAVELVPSVPGMMGWFHPDAAAVLADPDGRVIVADGRNHVELTDRRYDWIVVDPPPPIESAGVSVISSLEFYRAARARLEPGGLMVQWVPYGQTLDEFLAHVRSYLAVFPEVRVVAGPGGYGFFLLGSDAPVELDPAAMREVLARPEIAADLAEAPDAGGRDADAWVATLLGLEWAGGEALRAAVGEGPVVTDDRPLPEYFLLRRLADPAAPGLSLGGLRALLP